MTEQLNCTEINELMIYMISYNDIYRGFVEKREVSRNEVEEFYLTNTYHATQLYIFKDHKFLRVTNETRVGLGDTLL